MNWYQKQKEAGKVKDLAKGFGTGILMGLPLMGVSPSGTTYPNQQTVQVYNEKPTQPTTKPATQPATKPTAEPINMAELEEMLKTHEGFSNKVYLDSRLIPTVGIGFNLQRTDAKDLIEGLGLNYQSVLNGTQSLTNEQTTNLFNITVKEAVQNAKSLFTTFDEQPSQIKNVLIDMSFNLGKKGLGEFVKFRRAIDKKDYATAAKEMQQSAWFEQVKSRSRSLVSTVQSFAK